MYKRLQTYISVSKRIKPGITFPVTHFCTVIGKGLPVVEISKFINPKKTILCTHLKTKFS